MNYEMGAEQQIKDQNTVIDWYSDRGLNPGPLGWLHSTITTELNSHMQQFGSLMLTYLW